MEKEDKLSQATAKVYQFDESATQHFRQYGKSFQEKIFQCLLHDNTWASQMLEVMEPDYFELRYLAYLTDRYFAYFQKYKTWPTLQLLITIIKDDLSSGTDVLLRDQIIEYLVRVKSNPNIGDLQFVKDKTLDFCRRQAFKEALEEAVTMVSDDNFDSVVGLMKNAVSVGIPVSTGHDFFEDIEARFVKIDRQVCPTGIRQIDTKDILNGGLGRGELACIVANTGVGKSHFLVEMGSAALQRGKNVIHYTFELTETSVGLRYDSNLCGIPSNEVQDNKELVMKRYSDKDLGRLIIKEYPTGSCTINMMRSHIEKLSLKDFKPSLIVVDYADIMKSSKAYDSLRHELKLVYEELRNLAMELNVPIWTASQSNKDGSNSNVVGLENMGEAYAKAQICDVVLTISRKPEEKESGHARLFVAKNRAGRDGMLFPINIDTACSKFKVLTDTSMTFDEVNKNDNQKMKDLLKQKWHEVSGSKQ
jgi:replicative DNA helicase